MRVTKARIVFLNGQNHDPARRASSRHRRPRARCRVRYRLLRPDERGRHRRTVDLRTADPDRTVGLVGEVWQQVGCGELGDVNVAGVGLDDVVPLVDTRKRREPVLVAAVFDRDLDDPRCRVKRVPRPLGCHPSGSSSSLIPSASNVASLTETFRSRMAVRNASGETR